MAIYPASNITAGDWKELAPKKIIYINLTENMTMEIINGKTYINGLEKSPSICSKAKYALGLKKVKPKNVKTCSKEYWIEVVAAIGKYNKVSKEKIEKAKKSRIYL